MGLDGLSNNEENGRHNFEGLTHQSAVIGTKNSPPLPLFIALQVDSMSMQPASPSVSLL